MHPSDAKILQEIADMPIYYKVCDERVNIHDTTYHGTIRALHMAPKRELPLLLGLILSPVMHVKPISMVKAVSCYTSYGKPLS